MKVASWNIEGRLSRFGESGKRGSPEHIVRGIEELDSDVLFLPEAFDGAKPVEDHIMRYLEELGYTEHFAVSYDDRGDREYSATDDPHMMLLSRFEIVHQEVLPLVGGIRNMLVADVIDPSTGMPVRIFGIHLDDRTEEKRLCQVEDLVPRTVSSPLPVIAMGDFNATHKDSLPAHLFGSKAARFVADYFPNKRMQDILRRVSEMAIGDTLQRIETHTTLVDVDSRHRLTITPKSRGLEWLPSIRMLDIDHIYISPEIKASDFTVARDSGSDHRAISATLTVT